MNTDRRTGLSPLWSAALLVLVLMLGGCAGKILTFDGGSGDGSIIGEKVVQSAQAQQGVRYRMGGNAPNKGFDCSGLVSWAYSQHGVRVPRITKDQARAGYNVSRSDAQKGDILVFNTSSGPSGLHTALYAGGGRFVHSPTRGKSVRVDTLNSSYWGPRLIAVRRVVQ